MRTFNFYDMESGSLIFVGKFKDEWNAQNHGDNAYGRGCYFWEEED